MNTIMLPTLWSANEDCRLKPKYSRPHAILAVGRLFSINLLLVSYFLVGFERPLTA